MPFSHVVEQINTVAEFRKARLEGTDGHPLPVFDPDATEFTIPSSHGSHSIPLRVLTPTNGKSVGIFLHFHAIGFCIGSARSQDSYLRRLADALSVTVVSVDYRKAPENPMPAAVEDVLDASRI